MRNHLSFMPSTLLGSECTNHPNNVGNEEIWSFCVWLFNHLSIFSWFNMRPIVPVSKPEEVLPLSCTFLLNKRKLRWVSRGTYVSTNSWIYSHIAFKTYYKPWIWWMLFCFYLICILTTFKCLIEIQGVLYWEVTFRSHWGVLPVHVTTSVGLMKSPLSVYVFFLTSIFNGIEMPTLQ